ncbi:MAG: hypothetical protein RBR74_13160 [Ignavibacteriaceae bacterium]|jgi:hypothetical protein|nr:hypothetical protein [Ignavibacteriaceae bacterium]
MEQASAITKTTIPEKFAGSAFKDKLTAHDLAKTNPLLESILSEGGDDLFHYVNWLGLDKGPNLMVLSSLHHYYYDHNDLREIRTLINLKKLNHIKHLDSFLHTLYRILPSKSYFIGSFKSSIHNSYDLPFIGSVKFVKGFINMIDSKTDRILSKRQVTRLLEDHGFKLNDFTEINGITYFLAQNIRKMA